MQIIRVMENDTYQQMLQVNAAIATAKNFPKEGEFGCQHSVISPFYQSLFSLGPVAKGNNETTEELSDWHAGLTTVFFYNRLKLNA